MKSVKRTTVIVNRVNSKTGTVYSCNARIRNLIKIGTCWFWQTTGIINNTKTVKLIRAYMTNGIYVATVRI